MPFLSIQENVLFCLRLGDKACAEVLRAGERAAVPLQGYLPSFMQMWGGVWNAGRQRVVALPASLPGPHGSLLEPLAHAWCLSFPFC